ncbi:hypothetical protein MKW92_040086, partial [Papaver armeniacum]
VIPYNRFAFPPPEQQQFPGVIPRYYPLARLPMEQQQIRGVIPPYYRLARPPLEQQQIRGVIPPYYPLARPPLEQQQIQGVIPPLARPPQEQQQLPGVIPPLARPPLEQPVPLPPLAIEHPLFGMGEIPPHLQYPPHKLYQLCRKQLSTSDLQGRLKITGPNTGFLIQKAREAQLNSPILADVTILDGPGPSPHWLAINNNIITLAWNELFDFPNFELVEEQMVDMWFEIVPPTTMNIYIRGDPPLEDV